MNQAFGALPSLRTGTGWVAFTFHGNEMQKLPAEPWIDGCRGAHLHFYILTCLSPDAWCTMDHCACCHIALPSITSICLPPITLHLSRSCLTVRCVNTVQAMPLVEPLGEKKYNVIMLEYMVTTVRPAEVEGQELLYVYGAYQLLRFTVLTSLHEKVSINKVSIQNL